MGMGYFLRHHLMSQRHSHQLRYSEAELSELVSHLLREQKPETHRLQ
jgi:hypothetical protein